MAKQSAATPQPPAPHSSPPRAADAAPRRSRRRAADAAARRRRRRPIRNTTGRPRRATVRRHARQAARRSRQGHRPREVHLRHQPAAACSTAAIVRSPHPHARIVSIDFSAARARAGFQGGARRGAIRKTRRRTRSCSRVTRSRPSPPTPKNTPSTPRALVKVEYEVAAARDQRRSGAGRQRAGRCSPNGNVRQGADAGDRRSRGGIQGRRRTSLEQTYSTHVITHACLEAHGTVCEWEGDKLTAWVSTQGVSSARDNFANGLGDSADQRPRHLPVHGRRLRQQAAARTPRD